MIKGAVQIVVDETVNSTIEFENNLLTNNPLPTKI